MLLGKFTSAPACRVKQHTHRRILPMQLYKIHSTSYGGLNTTTFNKILKQKRKHISQKVTSKEETQHFKKHTDKKKQHSNIYTHTHI